MPDSGRGVSKIAKKYYFTNYSFEVKLCFVGIMSDRMYKKMSVLNKLLLLFL